MKEKKKKLNLDELEVQSFVTSFEISKGETQDIKGGYTHECTDGGCGGGSGGDTCDTIQLCCGTLVSCGTCMNTCAPTCDFDCTHVCTGDC